MKTLSNGKILSRYSTVPYCLDNEYVPASDQQNWYQSEMTAETSKKLRQGRNASVKRELIRTLIYSPQVIVGRQSLVNEEVLVGFAKEEEESLMELLEQGRIALLLGRSNGKKGNSYEEQDMLDFLDHKPFPFTPEFEGEPTWRRILSNHGAKYLPYLRLNPVESAQVPARFTTLFLALDVDETAMDTLFQDCLGRATTLEERLDFRKFWQEDISDFAGFEKRNRKTISRTAIYQEYVWSPLRRDTDYLKSRDAVIPGMSSLLVETRRKYQVIVKRITDLAYNANLPFTIDVKSFVPPNLPDPSSLPGHIYQHAHVGSEEVERQQAAVKHAWSEWADVAADTSRFFFHKMQHRCVLPEFNSFSLRDAVEVSAYPEWKAFAAAQRAAMNFRSADELRALLNDYWETITDLHIRLGKEMEHRGWRAARSGAVTMGLAVSAHILGHALLPSVAEAWPWWATVTASTVLAKPIHAGIDFVLHFQDENGNLIQEGGFKQGDLHEFTLGDDEIAKLERLHSIDRKIEEIEKASQEIVGQASATIASEG